LIFKIKNLALSKLVDNQEKHIVMLEVQILNFERLYVSVLALQRHPKIHNLNMNMKVLHEKVLHMDSDHIIKGVGPRLTL
jgi:hypothetical protein